MSCHKFMINASDNRKRNKGDMFFYNEVFQFEEPGPFSMLEQRLGSMGIIKNDLQKKKREFYVKKKNTLKIQHL